MQDSLLAAPIILDLVILAELSSRIGVKTEGGDYEPFHPVLSILSFLLKAPVVPKGAPLRKTEVVPKERGKRLNNSH